jgi:signal recognition particle subunit SRP54
MKRRRKEFAQKLKSGKGFDLNDFKEQLGQMKQDGRPVSLMDKLPAQFAGAAGSSCRGGQEKRRSRASKASSIR